jgi:hypothetical protein
MAAQALCEPAPKDYSKLIANFKAGVLSAISRHEILVSIFLSQCALSTTHAAVLRLYTSLHYHRTTALHPAITPSDIIAAPSLLDALSR